MWKTKCEMLGKQSKPEPGGGVSPTWRHTAVVDLRLQQKATQCGDNWKTTGEVIKSGSLGHAEREVSRQEPQIRETLEGKTPVQSHERQDDKMDKGADGTKLCGRCWWGGRGGELGVKGTGFQLQDKQVLARGEHSSQHRAAETTGEERSYKSPS